MAGQEARFLTGSTMGHVVRMTLTGAIGITFVFIVDAANLFWISWLGDPRLVAAIGFAFAIQFLSVSGGVGLMIAATALVSRRMGQGDHSGAREMATATMIITTIIQSIAALLIVLFRWQLLDFAGAEGETRDLAARYLLFTVPSLAMMAFGLVGSATLRAYGDGKRAMFVTLTSGSVSVFVDPLLIIWAGLGLDGAAYALILSRFVLTVMALYYASYVHDLLARPNFGAIRENLKPFLVIAMPAMIAQVSTPFGGYLLTSVMAQFGDAAVGAWAVVNRLYVMAFGGIFSLGGAIGGILGQNFGAGLFDRVRTTYRDALVFCLVYALIAWGVLAAATPVLITAFGLDAAGADILKSFTRIAAAYQGVMGMVYVTNAAFNTLGKPGRSMVVNWTRDGILILPIAWWASSVWGATGVVYGQALAGTMIGAIAAIWAWSFVKGFQHGDRADLDLTTRRGYRDLNRYRRR